MDDARLELREVVGKGGAVASLRAKPAIAAASSAYTCASEAQLARSNRSKRSERGRISRVLGLGCVMRCAGGADGGTSVAVLEITRFPSGISHFWVLLWSGLGTQKVGFPSFGFSQGP